MANTTFLSREDIGYASSSQYKLLPFRFDRWADGRYFLTNEIGEFIWLLPESFQLFVNHRLINNELLYEDLKAKHFLIDNFSSPNFGVLASKYRTKKAFLDGFTKLHIFVTTLRCNQSCPYCQVSRQSTETKNSNYDMPLDVLERSVRLMLESPAKQITMEFQGGEPLVRFDLLQEAVRLTKNLNTTIGKKICFVVCTNLSLLEDKHLDWCKENNIQISTSLDGPAELHDKNRPLNNSAGSHAIVTKNIRRAQEALGYGYVSALMTTTKESLRYPKEIVDEYLRLKLSSIFLRELNPYGFATRSAKSVGYSIENFFNFYQTVMNYILTINRAGQTFSESYASLILSKILTPWPVGFVDLQSPSGAGINVCLYNYDGEVYASDEARMLAESGDTTFRLGSILEDSYENIFFGDQMQTIAAASCNEALAGCSDCAYQTYCGADPVRHWRLQKDFFGNRGIGDSFCKKNMAIIKFILNLINKEDDDLMRIFWSWIRREDINNLHLKNDL